MNKRYILFFVFIICLFITGILMIIVTKVNFVENTVQIIFSPIQKGIVYIGDSLHIGGNQGILKEENSMLLTKLAKEDLIVKENQALQDQFKTTNPSAQNLLPSHIVGEPSFLPGISLPEFLIIDKGKADGVNLNDAVIYKDNLIGKITQVRSYFSQVTLSTNTASSFTVATAETNAQGVVKGQGENQLILDNVVLSDTLKINDLVVTAGSTDILGNGYPPGLVVGKITSVDKNPSSLFQQASVSPLIDVTKIPMVFVLVQKYP